MESVKKVVLAYSGGLDTSILVKWLIEKYGCEVVAYCADVGQQDELEGLEEKAIRTGASKIYIEDLKEEFARDFVFFAIKANAIYEGTYMLGTSLARPLIAKKHVEIARKEGADAVCHGSTGKGNDQVRFELTFYALEPHIKVIAPWREWDFTAREQLIDYARTHDIPVPVSKEKPYSMDRNLMHISYEGGVLEDPWNEPDEAMFRTTVSPEKAPNQPRYVEIEFKEGVPVRIDGQEMKADQIIMFLNRIAGENGVGRVDIVENRFVGMKSRGVYETPGCTVLHTAHRAMESITMDREVMHLRDSLIPKISELIYYGFWYSPEMEVIRALVDESQKAVSGTVRVKLYKGNCIVVGRKSENSLYREDFATFDQDTVYNQSDATGFIRLNALRLRVRAMLKGK
ncbi:MAG TPA: argininosuccinate synthase [Deltaproteobacteria bacterium]|nr:argininosuccinate synthase [Deltaproteobacteria bacterium]